VYWNTETAGWYSDNGAGGVGIFRQDTAWTYTGAITFATPEPGSITLILVGSMILLAVRRRTARKLPVA
jgi:hypothetical protein